MAERSAAVQARFQPPAPGSTVVSPVIAKTASAASRLLHEHHEADWLTGQIMSNPAFWSQTNTRPPAGDQSSIIGCAG